jgi:hypothetical protein
MARFLVKMAAQQGDSLAADPGKQSAAGFTLTQLMPNSRETARQLGLASEHDWYLATTESGATDGDAWDECHTKISSGLQFGMAAGGVSYAEPDMIQSFVEAMPTMANALPVSPDGNQPQEQTWMGQDMPHGAKSDWHLDSNYSELRLARNSLSGDWKVRIGHLDTGYAKDHKLLPERLNFELQRSFVDGENEYSAVDPGDSGPLKNPGHGTGTLCLLAGGKLSGLIFEDENLGDYLGGAPHAEVIPVRIAESVMLMWTSAFVRGLDYLLAPNGDLSKRVDVVSMSMGGVCSSAWTDIVNRAYDAGVVLCTAAGNHYGALPPTKIVYPARYKRVIAACGVMADGRPYADLPVNVMCGCYGPDSKMATAIAAYTPNVPWALLSNLAAFRWDGQGTSAATPQVAAAAALYVEKNYDQLSQLQGWQKVEAVRAALFGSAARAGNAIDSHFGRGMLKANSALAIGIDVEALTKLPEDTASWPFFKVLTDIGLAAADPATAMLQVEMMQLTQKNAELAKILVDPEATMDPNCLKVKEFFSAITTIPAASKYLKAALSAYLKTGSTVPDRMEQGPWKPPHPPCRKLRGYVFDPSMSTKLQYVDLSETTYRVRWEPLDKGPIGEYFEVCDGSHDPIELDVPSLLAQDGLQPSESSPQFRQQMVYAVGMQIIDVFESALGRLVNWAALSNGSFNQRLKLYPEGIEAPNAFYSPTDKAIYFGRFQAMNLKGEAYPGKVYTALSHDIIAHEMTHALLDGIHSSFRDPTNPDVLAFHEAFADIVALLQQFSNIDVVRSQAAAVRGDLSMESLLGNLARQFGEATSGRAALRSGYLSFKGDGDKADALKPDKDRLKTVAEPHERGAILVAAVYGAFLAIYKTRTVDLYRIASDGKSEVALHGLSPDIVNRIALEASRAALHVMKMCIRAIDYCPPVDINFGDFLRAIVTADMDVVPDDPLHYRVGFIESFRSWGIYPEGLQALSSETLAYPPMPLLEGEALNELFELLSNYAAGVSLLNNREQIFDRHKDATADVQKALRAMAVQGQLDEWIKALEFDKEIPLEVTRVRFSFKTSPSGSIKRRVLISLVQSDGFDPAGLQIRWGATLVLDLSATSERKVLYCINKPKSGIPPSRMNNVINKGPSGGSRLSKLALEEPFMLLHQT